MVVIVGDNDNGGGSDDDCDGGDDNVGGGDDCCDVDGNDIGGNDGGDERLVVEVVSDSNHFVFQGRKCMQEIFKINEYVTKTKNIH